MSTTSVSRSRQLHLYIIDPSVWFPVLAGRVPVAELLSSDLETHRVWLVDADGTCESFALVLNEVPTLDQLLHLCRLKLQDWAVEFVSSPTRSSLGEGPTGDTQIAPTMEVVLRARRRPTDSAR